MGLAGDFIIGQANNVTDSAIRSNGSLLFSSGGGTERLRIDSSGRLGIGATDLSAYELDADDLVIKQDSGNAGLTIHSASNGVGSIYFADGTTGTEGYRGRIEYNQSVDTMSFGTASTGSRVVIDDSGRLLVGTLSSDAQRTSKFQLAGNGDLSGWGSSLNLSEFGTSYNPWIVLQRSRNSTIGSHTVVNSGDILGGIQFNGSDGNSFESGASIKCEVDGTPGDGDMPGRLVFSTTADGASSPTERMRITSKGALKASTYGSYISSGTSYHELLGNSAGTYSLLVGNNAAGTPDGISIYFSNASPDNNTNYFIKGQDTTTNRFYIYSDGDVWTSDAGTLTSDVTLKRDITDASPKLADVMNLRVRNFYWQEDYHPNKQDKKLIGFVAQEFEEVFPGLVSEHKIRGGEPVLDEDGNETGETTPEVFKKGIKEAKLVPILVKALQEAVERIETLEAKVAALEAN